MNLSSSSGINNLLPFLLNYLLSVYDAVTFNGYEKKLIQAKIIGALINNSNLDHEFYVLFLLPIFDLFRLDSHLC